MLREMPASYNAENVYYLKGILLQSLHVNLGATAGKIKS